MKIWFLISEEARQALAKLYRKLAGYPFTPPRDDFKPIKVKGKLESTEEIGRLMRQPTRFRRPPK